MTAREKGGEGRGGEREEEERDGDSHSPLPLSEIVPVSLSSQFAVEMIKAKVNAKSVCGVMREREKWREGGGGKVKDEKRKVL